MILDRIENASRYLHLGNGISLALNYIQNNDLSQLSPGRYEIDGDRLVMLVQQYENTNTNECRLEGHRKYIDLQYWISGSELMGHDLLDAQPVLEPYNEKTDCAFYSCISSFNRLTPGMFVVYYPTDLHTSVADPLSKAAVQKVVFKIMVEA